MKILKLTKNNKLSILSQYYFPDVAITGQLLAELSEGLEELGFEVKVITAFPSYDGRIEAKKHEILSGVSIYRVWSTRINKNSIIGKIINSATFFLSSLIFLIRYNSTDQLLIVSNPPFLPLIGVILNIFRRKPYVYLVHDVYPDIATRLGYIQQHGMIERLWKKINYYIFKNASKIIVLSDSMAAVITKNLVESNLSDHIDKIEIIHNWANGNFIKPIEKKNNIFLQQNDLEDKFVILYSGNIGLFHQLEMVIETARIIQDDNVRFVFIGEGGKKNRLIEMTLKYGLRNVVFLPYQSKEMLPYSLSSSSLSLVSLEENIEGLAMPSKLYSTMAGGNAIVAICDKNSDVARIINSADCGFIVSHRDVESLVAFIRKMQNNPENLKILSRNARSYFEQHYTFSHALHRYAEVLSTS